MIDGEEIFERVEPEWSPGGQKDVPVSFTEKSHKRQYVRELSTGCGKVLASAFSAIRDEQDMKCRAAEKDNPWAFPHQYTLGCPGCPAFYIGGESPVCDIYRQLRDWRMHFPGCADIGDYGGMPDRSCGAHINETIACGAAPHGVASAVNTANKV